MNTTAPNRPGRPVIQRAAGGGLTLGIYLSVLALASGASLHVSLLSWVVNGLSIAIPFFVYAILRRSLAETGFKATFAEMWAEGIAVFFLGSAIQAVVIYLGLRYWQPDLMSLMVDQTLAAFAQAQVAVPADAASALELVRRLSPTDVLAQIMSMNLIGGMIISLILAAVLSVRYASQSRRQRYLEKHPDIKNGN